MVESKSKQRQAEARARVAAARAQQLRQERGRRLRLYLGGAVGVLVVVLAVVVVGITHSGSSGSKTSSSATPVPAADGVVSDVTGISPSTLNTVGAGSASPLIHAAGQPPLTINGLPGVVYVGAEYCPYCAAERWSLVQALSRFGTFSGLYTTHSSATDVNASTPTFTFVHAHYVSKYLSFSPVEVQGPVQGTALQTPTALQARLFAKYDSPPYIGASYQGSFPFVDFGNRYLALGATYQSTEMSHLSVQTVAGALNTPSTAEAQGVDGTANEMTAAMCTLTKGAPSSVCTAPGVLAAQALLAKAQTVNAK